ncbi:MAG: hypothetical protein JOY77_14025 [Alphaproteobacteria bacterium]|nr:hypothetical protein [Alphaproteobacteria bacterium]MBV9064025.1 hypothetical protein [Alphaproteobacteria bacterium]
MLAVHTSAWRLGRADVLLPVLLILAMLVAAAGPFDLAVHLASGGVPVRRILLIAMLVIAGATCASLSGLSMQGTSKTWPLIAIGSALGVAAYVCLVDGWLFRASVPAEYVHAVQMHPLRDRLAYYFLRAFQENVIYRMFVFSALTLAVSKLSGRSASEISTAGILSIALTAQILNIAINVVALEPAASFSLTYDSVRFVVPGMFWGWLYWRHGFVTTELGHVACHAFLQPALGILI